MTMRIPPKPDRAYPGYLRWMYRRQERRYGQRLYPTQVWGRVPVLLRRFLSLFRAFERSASPLDPVLRALVTVRVSQINHCAFCIDFNAMRVMQHANQADRLEGLADFESSPHFSAAEKAALAYAEAITYTDREADDALFARLRTHYNDDAIVELTGLIAFQNMSSKFNAALDLPAQGLCRLPPAP
jgi:alkylhydroperoxidase family enzyme